MLRAEEIAKVFYNDIATPQMQARREGTTVINVNNTQIYEALCRPVLKS
jgi:hypothetical protein